MSLVPSLLQAIVKVDGEAMVMHAGDKPYVVSPTGQVELASRGLTLDAVNGIVGQLLPSEIQKALEEFGAIQYELPALPEFPSEHFTVVAARGGDDVWVEIRRRRVPDEDRVPDELFPAAAAPVVAAPVAPPPPAVAAPAPAVPVPVAAVATARASQPEASAAHATTPTMSVASEPAHHAVPPVAAVVGAGDADEGEEINLDDDLALPNETQLFGAPVKPFTDSELAEGQEHEIDVDAEPEVAASVPENQPGREAELAEAVVAKVPDAVADLAPLPATPIVEPAIAAETIATPVAEVEWTPATHVEAPLVSDIATPKPEALAQTALHLEDAPNLDGVAPPAPETIAPTQPEMVVAKQSEWWMAEPEPEQEQELLAPPQPEAISEIAALPEVTAWPEPEPIRESAPVELVVAPSVEPVASPEIELMAAIGSELVVPPAVEAIAPEPAEVIATPVADAHATQPAFADVWADVVSEIAPAAAHLIAESMPPAEAVAPPQPEMIAAPASEPVATPEPELIATPMAESYATAPQVIDEPQPVATIDVPPPTVDVPPATIDVPPAAARVDVPVAERRVLPRRAAPPPRPVPTAAPPAQRWAIPPNVEPASRHVPVGEASVSRVDEPISAAPEPRPVAPVMERPSAHNDEFHEIAVAPAPQAAVVLPISRSPIRGDQLAPALSEATMPGLDRLLRLASARGASTLYLSSESRPSMRIDGELHVIDAEPVHTSRDVESLLLTLMPERNHEALRSGAQTEWICDIDGVGRVRCMSFRDHRGPGGVFRLMPTRSVSVEQLGLPRHVQSLAIEPSGLVLIAGPRSSGKRTLMAAFVDLMNRTRRDHIITIEREINIVQEGGHSFISQREVRGDDDEMVAAARTALREDPDVLVIEDLRTGPLMNVALEAAAAGRLVVGGFSAHTAGGAIDRIIDLYAPEYRRQVQIALADSLRGVVVQVLLRKIGGGRIPAREVLLNTPAVSNVIAEGKTSQLPVAIEGGRRYGMVPMNDALVALVQSGAVEAREAYRQSPDRPGFLGSLAKNGLDTSFVERLA
jgi:twitching motility protein PilT